MNATACGTAILSAFALVFAACGTDGASGDPGPSDTPAPGRIVVDAPIDEADLIIRESFPPQYAVRIVSGIPDGCHEFNDIATSRNGATIEIKVTNTKVDDPDAICTQIYGMHEETVELGSDFDAGVQYIVLVGDKTLTFTGEGGPATAEE